MEYLKPLQVIWDYLCLREAPVKADCIVGFGNFNVNIARRAAEEIQEGIFLFFSFLLQLSISSMR